MKLTVFGSSSSGNGYALEFDNGKLLLIEAGVPIVKYLEAFPDRWGDLIGCLVSHEHQDHIRYIKEYVESGITVYGSEGTFESVNVKQKHKLSRFANNQMIYRSDSLLINAFKVIHNAKDPSGFLIIDRETDEALLFITDSAYLEYRFTEVDYMMIECNYIEQIAQNNLLEGRYSASKYHMSLQTCKQFLAHCDLKSTRKIILIHLSDSNSDEQRMIREVKEQTGIETVAALPGAVYELRKDPF